ncbi:hypothetical protein LUZ60_011585 [Juncus effusus]|nr:hypothetical protein LUZ60_011585 [Juncus effusus]
MVSSVRSLQDISNPTQTRLNISRNSTQSTSLLIRAIKHRASHSSFMRIKQTISRTKRVIISKKNQRRKLLESSRKSATQIVRKIQMLRRLVPGGDSTEIDDLFRVAADYILSLQMQVRVMEYMVNALNPKDCDNRN